MSQLMSLPLTVSCFSKIQIGFTFLVPAHLGSPGKRAVKRVCVCVYVSLMSPSLTTFSHCHSTTTTMNDSWRRGTELRAFDCSYHGLHKTMLVSEHRQRQQCCWLLRYCGHHERCLTEDAAVLNCQTVGGTVVLCYSPCVSRQQCSSWTR